jgi:hypothetical protein
VEILKINSHEMDKRPPYRMAIETKDEAESISGRKNPEAV